MKLQGSQSQERLELDRRLRDFTNREDFNFVQQRVIFAPDWREGCPYQQLLADALELVGVDVRFLSWYRRVMPLTRGVNDIDSRALLHLHWADPYIGRTSRITDLAQTLRLPLDLAFASRKRPLVVTAHNLFPHNRRSERAVQWAIRKLYRRADRVIAHSEASRDQLMELFGIKSGQIHVIPHGPSSDDLGEPLHQEEARQRLKLDPDRPACLMFGVIEPYKGIEEAIAFWTRHQPNAQLLIVGRPRSLEYQQQIESLIAGNPNIRLRAEFVTRDELRAWVSAADCCLFNYREILTSGSILIPRSWGIPVLLPQRLRSLELGEPDSRIIRFESLDDRFSLQLQQAIALSADYDSAKQWRAENSWERIARKTAALYAELI